MHIPVREQVLRRLWGLRPGGILMIEEHDAFPALATAAGACREAWLAFIRACRAAGTDPGWARDGDRLGPAPARLRTRGQAAWWSAVHTSIMSSMVRGGSGGMKPSISWSRGWTTGCTRPCSKASQSSLASHTST